MPQPPTWDHKPMSFMNYFKLYLLTVPVFLAIDMVWLGWLARDFYKENLGYILSPEVNWGAAIVFYLLFIVGTLYFAVAPALAQGSIWRAVLNGALFGLFAYTTYELTNLATLPNWPMKVVLIDTAWGVTLSASVATFSYLIGRWLQGA
jgi:uncharacterized membrane protein